MRKLFGYILAVMLCAIVLGLVFGCIMSAMPGLFPVLVFAVCWWAKPLPVYDLDAELAALLGHNPK